MNESTTESTLGKKLIGLTAALAVGLGVTLTGCAPDDAPPPPDPEAPPALPGEPMPEQPQQPPIPEPEQPQDGQ